MRFSFYLRQYIFGYLLCGTWIACNSQPEPVAPSTISEPLKVETPQINSQFDAAGFAFNLPNNWGMTDTLEAGGGYYVSCEHLGESQSGMVAITKIEDAKITLKKMIEQRCPKGTLIQDGVFAGYNALTANFEKADGTVKMTKVIYAFEACDAKYVFTTLSEAQNQQENESDFAAIQSSWKCR